VGNLGVTTSTAGDELTLWAVGSPWPGDTPSSTTPAPDPSYLGPTLVFVAAPEEAVETTQLNAGEWDLAQSLVGSSGNFIWSLPNPNPWASAVIALRPATN
ncbi:MAG TPA: hypothetical protein VEI83_11840, partial [Acidimicrobiales bacterium]|nr:hypothetical protein [Acidimicrobiales bacterium]